MSEFVEVKTSDLAGAALDWAVTKAEVYPGDMPAADILWGKYCSPYSPSTDWSYGGPLIEKHQIDLTFERKGTIYAYPCNDDGLPDTSRQSDEYGSFGPTYLIAACRAIVASVLGETVSVPKELV